MPREVRVKFIGQGWCAVVCVSYMLAQSATHVRKKSKWTVQFIDLYYDISFYAPVARWAQSDGNSFTGCDGCLKIGVGTNCAFVMRI